MDVTILAVAELFEICCMFTVTEENRSVFNHKHMHIKLNGVTFVLL